jgi:hypothetical protein
MHARLAPHSDCHPATVIRIVSEKTVDVQMDSWKLVRGSEHDGSAEYTYERAQSSGFVRRNVVGVVMHTELVLVVVAVIHVYEYLSRQRRNVDNNTNK